MEFKIGDSVQVKTGVTDEEWGTDFSGWQGRVIEVVTDPEPLLDLAWDSQTLQQMPETLIANCFEAGFSIESFMLGADEVVAAKPRDTEKDVHNTLAEIYGRYGLEYQTDLESMVISMADMAGLLSEDDEDWDDEFIQPFDIDQFFADLHIEDAKEQKRIRSCFAQALEIYYEYIYGYHKYGRKPEFLIAERMGEPYIFGFGLVEVLRARRGIKETTKLAICQYTLQTIVPEEEYGIPHGLIVLLSYLAQTGYLSPDVFRAVMQVTNLLRQWIWPWQIEEAIQLSDWLITQDEIPSQEKVFWLWHLSMQLDANVHLGKKLVNHWLAHPDLAADLKKELVHGWLDEVRKLGTPPAAWRLVMAQTTGDLAEAEKALQELGASHKEIKQVKAIIEEEAKRDVFSKLFSRDPLLNFSPEWGHLLTPNWLKRIAVLALVKLGEDAWETAVLYLDSTRDYGAEAINQGVADIIAAYADVIPSAEIRELIEKGIQIPQVSVRKTFYRLSTNFFGTELLEKTAVDNAASVRKWGAKELKKLGG
jgi:hypothetical protein